MRSSTLVQHTVTANSKWYRLLALLGCGLFSLGCSGTSNDGYSGPRGTVSGTVKTAEGPLEAECQILFMNAEKGYTASGVIRSGGTYVLSYTSGPGLPAGIYQVQFAPPIPIGGATSSGTGGADPEDMKAKMKMPLFNKGKPVKPKEDISYFPAKYASFQSGKLRFTVVAGANVADFDLVP